MFLDIGNLLMTVIEAPIFISGHTRSGTNLLLRLIDGAPELVAPPGEGKINILRRFNHLSAYQNVRDNVELNIDSSRIKRVFAGMPESQLERGFCGGVFTLVDSLYGSFAKSKYDFGLNDRRWVEKNHNLEFYFARAKLLFGDIKMVYVLRNPLDNWLSWKKYVQKYSLDMNASRLCFNIINHVINEIKEHAVGLKQYGDIDQMLAFYGVKHSAINRLMELLFTPDKMDASCDFSNLFNSNNYLTGVDPEQFFAVNYLYMFRKAKYLSENYPKNFMIVRYEDVVRETDRMMKQIALFCGYTHSDINLKPTDGTSGWGGNSSHADSGSPASEVSNASIGRWKNHLQEKEVNNINSILEKDDVYKLHYM